MASKAQSKLVLASSLLPLAAVLLGAIAWIFNLQNTIASTAETVEAITEQLDAAAAILEVSPYGETMIEQRINGVEHFVYEELETRIREIETRLLLIDESISDIRDTQAGTSHYLYNMDEGPSKQLAEHTIELTKLRSEITNILNSHVWYNAYIERLDAQLLESMGIRIQVPADSFTSGGYR